MGFSPKIYGFGSACVDYRIHIPDMGRGYTSKILADSVIELGGGACSNCLVQAARLSGDCTYFGKLGRDPQAEIITSLFLKENVKFEIIESEKGTLSPFNVAIYKGSENERVGGYLLPNSLETISYAEAVGFANSMEEGSSAMVEIGEIPLESVLGFIKAALNKNIRIFIDVDLDPIRQLKAPFDLFEEILGLADVIIPNYEAVKDVYNIQSRSELAAHMSLRYGKTVIITAGSKGAYYSKNGERAKNLPADDINIVDTVGAGDSFHGSLIYSMSHGNDLEQSIKFAIKCASMTCMGFGARTSMPFLKDVKHMLI